MSLACPECKKGLSKAFTCEGVEIDYCPQCKGIWLDKGEIYFFTDTPTYLKYKIEEALKDQKPSDKIDPKTGEPLVSITLFDNFNIDYSPRSQGIWFEEEELEKLPTIDRKKIKITIDEKLGSENPIEKKAGTAPVLSPLPNLVASSTFTIAGLYALLTIVLILCVEFLKLDASAALVTGITFAFIHFLLGPFLMDMTLNIFFKISWKWDVPEHLKTFVEKICRENKMAIPKIGVILDGSPQAFTYGHTPNDARIVISLGLLNLLNEDELEAVVAHEIGHAKHWDMLVMTLASLVPMVLYYLYRTLIRIKSKGRDKTALPRYIIAIISYLLYIISEYVVLWFSRIREYYADRFSGEVTNNPNSLSSALVKIGYGLAGEEPQYENKEKKERKPQLGAVETMGIFDKRTASCLAISGFNQAMTGQIDKERLKDAAKWDLWNPWALFFELSSTHPLIAKRINRLSEQSAYIGKTPFVEFNRDKPECYWDDFLFDVAIAMLPLFLLFSGLALYWLQIGACCGKGILSYLFIGFGTGYLINTLYSYKGQQFPEINISGLLSKVKVSGIRPVPCRLKGKIIGRGVPGLIWSEDFVLKDDTGIIFLDYRQPLGIWSFFFGLLGAKNYINEDVEAIGWYRRSPVPFIELKTLTSSHGKEQHCYVYPVKLTAAIVIIIAGIFLI